MTIKVIEIEVNPQADKPVTIAICPWNTTMFGINAAQNILTSGQYNSLSDGSLPLSSKILLGMLVWRIWRIGRLVDKNTNYPGGHETPPQRPLQKLIRAVVESGTVYTTIVFATFLASASGSNAVYITAGMASISTCIYNRQVVD
jgi:hypothetical protein